MSFRFTGLILAILVSVPCYSQVSSIETRLVHFSKKKMPVREYLHSIFLQEGIGYACQSGNEYLDSLGSGPRKPTPLVDALTNILAPWPMGFRIDHNQRMIILFKKEVALPAPAANSPALLLTVNGLVVDENRKALDLATIQIKNDFRQGTQSDQQGRWQLKNVPKDAVLVISYSGMKTVERPITGPDTIRVQLIGNMMENIVVQPTNGYQPLPRENATVSTNLIDSAQLSQHIMPNVTDVIENSGPGVLSLHGVQTSNGNFTPSPIQIRGLSTFLANSAPLVVLNNFPYDGNINNINPNEIESITILKDAAAAAIWGARAGNGVIVIVMKKAGNGAPRLVYQSTVGVRARPNLRNIPSISSGDFLDVEKQLFDAGYFAYLDDPQNYIPAPPGVLLLQEAKQGSISPAAAEWQRAALRKQDVRDDMSKYLYRNSVNQQHLLQLSGSGTGSHYYFSADYDHDISNVAATQYRRLTLRSQNSFQLSRRLQIEAGVNYAETDNKNGDNIQYSYQSPLRNNSIYPYAKLADGQGHALPLSLDYSSNYLQQARAAGFADWRFKPLSELAAEVNKVKTRDYLLTTAIKYMIRRPLMLEIRYQFEDQMTTGNDNHSDSSYYTRNLRNSVGAVDPVTGTVNYPFAAGGIYDVNSQEIVSHQGRIQLDYNRKWRKQHALQAIAGYEIRSIETTGNGNRYYGYDPENSAVSPIIDYTRTYLQYLTNAPRMIPVPQAISRLADHFISWYGTAAYSYRNRYHLSGSIRRDEANLFGVATNEKGVPLWSAGVAWQADQEKWYPINKWLPLLKFRATYGEGGNIARLASAYTTTFVFAGGVSGSTYPMQAIQSPPNKNLRWERVGQLNFGIDFALPKNIVTGTIDYYQKHARDLLAQTVADPTLGLTQSPGIPGTYYGNTGGLNGHGIDLQLDIHVLDSGLFRWRTNLYLSYSASKVEQYLNPVGLGNLYRDQTAINPVKGRPLYSLYSFKNAGLDPQTGAFRGVYQGKMSTDYDAIYNNTPLADMQFSGPAQPTYFGSMRNSFALGSLSVSLLVSFQAGHYYRQPATNQSYLALNWRGYSDFANRWQHPGDEQRTNVPAFHYPIDGLQDLAYVYSSSLVKKADEIRWDELTIGYEFDKQKQKRLPFQHVRIYGTAMGMGLLWAANTSTDPYFINAPKDRPRYSLGLILGFLPFQPAK